MEVASAISIASSVVQADDCGRACGTRKGTNDEMRLRSNSRECLNL